MQNLDLVPKLCHFLHVSFQHLSAIQRDTRNRFLDDPFFRSSQKPHSDFPQLSWFFIERSYGDSLDMCVDTGHSGHRGYIG